jgi:glutaredoxin
MVKRIVVAERLGSWAFGVVAALLATALAAQPIYRIVGPDGRVTYSDKPPAAAGLGKVTEAGRAPDADAANPLPLNLRTAARQYPVTLYTTANCTPCATGRALLVRRGVPFTEKTVSSPEDAEALHRLSGESALPLLTIGAQQIKGWTEGQWQLYLDAAGYPKLSQLPRTYQWPTATPLVDLVPATAPAAEQAPASSVDAAPVAPPAPTPRPAAAPRPPAGANTSNPAGITF